MHYKRMEENNSFHQRLLPSEDILDQAVYEKVWMTVGDNKEIDVDRLIKQGRISK